MAFKFKILKKIDTEKEMVVRSLDLGLTHIETSSSLVIFHKLHKQK